MKNRLLNFAILAGVSAAAALAQTDVLTQHNNPARTGIQLHETILTPANVRAATFGRLYERSVEGQIITQPLYESNLSIPGQGTKNVVFVATRANWIYAFDADNLDTNPSHGLVWTAPVQIEPDAPAPMCLETRGPLGITSTPVIDRASGTMYVTARKSDGTLWLHALDVTTGKPKAGTPGSVKLAASVTVAGHAVAFDQTLELQRTGLLLENGVVYFAFGALNCDNKGWHGWVLAYRTSDLHQVGAFVTSRVTGSTGAGIWQSGNGLVGDGIGNIYFATGNDGADGPHDLGESFLKLHLGPAPSYGLSLVASYTVTNYNALNAGDTDLGSGGPVLLPGNHLVGGGKQGKLYVLDAATMHATQFGPSGGNVPPGGSDGFQAFFNSWHNNANSVECTSGEFIIEFNCFVPHPRYETGELFGPNIHGAPLYWDAANPAYGLLYGMPEKDFLRSYRFDHATHQLASAPSAVSSVRSPDGMPGSHLSLSANGSSNGIVWASVPNFDGQWEIVPGSLVAFDAITLAELWRDDDTIAFAKFTPPTVAGGKVFRPTFANKLIVYGLRGTPAVTPCYNIAQKYQNYSFNNGVLGASTSAESTAPDGVGHFEHFVGGSIYWTPTTCAHQVQDDIHAKWSSIGWEKSALGYPTTDQTGTPDGIGRYNHFQSGSIYWTPRTGAFEVHGAIRERWASLGWERSALGYPLSDETDEVDGSGRFNVFEHGSIHWKRATGAITVVSNANILVGPTKPASNRPGGDTSSFDLPAATPAMCQQSCADSASCQSWTYVNPGVQGPKARCWLKNTIPVETGDACCTSGIKVDVHPSNMPLVAGRSNRPGSDFTSFNLVVPDYRLCEGECARNATCKAWTFVDERVQGPQARCWLKNAIPAATQSDCCVSGAK